MNTSIENQIKKCLVSQRSDDDIVKELHIPLDVIKAIREKSHSLEKESKENLFPTCCEELLEELSQETQAERKQLAKVLLEQGFPCDTTGILSNLTIFKIRRLKGEVIKKQGNQCRCRNPSMRLMENPWGRVLCSIFVTDYLQNNRNARREIDFQSVYISAIKTIQIMKNEDFGKSFEGIENYATIGTFYEIARKLREAPVSGEETLNKGRYKKLVRLGIDVDICQECGQEYLYVSSNPTKTCCFCDLSDIVKNGNMALT